MWANSTKVYKLIYAVFNLLGTLLAVNNTHTLYSNSNKPKEEMKYPKPRIINHSEIEFVSNKREKQ
ncbi:MAG: hypothetical protein ACRC8M_06540 [Cetobacterium sp.]|uniref:hypothetical protein n=1 Tax=Cetobacterium sp. TaxID=2071632 RepID=UPI003F388CE7